MKQLGRCYAYNFGPQLSSQWENRHHYLRSGALEQHLSQFHCTKKVGVTTQSIHGTTVYLYVYLHETIKVKHSWIGKYAIRPMDLSWDCSLSNHPLLEEKISVVAG